MKCYKGSRTIDGISVTVDGQALDPACDVQTYTDLGFEWTYEGASPRQLALALLYNHLGDGARAVALSEPFMKSVIAQLENDWELSSTDIDTALQDISDTNETG